MLADQIRETQPDIVLLHWDAAREELLDQLLKSGPAFVLLAGQQGIAPVAANLGAGVRAVLPHHASAEEISAAVEAVAGGLIVLHPDVMTWLQLTEPVRHATVDRERALTPREIEVLRMLAEGMANKNIAWRLGISEHTVKFHIASIFAKLDAATRAEAVAIGMRQGLIMM